MSADTNKIICYTFSQLLHFYMLLLQTNIPSLRFNISVVPIANSEYTMDDLIGVGTGGGWGGGYSPPNILGRGAEPLSSPA